MRVVLQLLLHALARALLRLFYGYRAPCQITDDPCVIVANHNTHLDVFALFALVPLSHVPRLHAVAAADYFEKGLLGWLARAFCSVILVDRTAASHHGDPLRPAVEALQKGQSLVIFPEGSRGKPGQLLPFRAGIGKLALQFPDQPIHPVALSGIERTMPRSRPLPIPFNVAARLGAPLRVADLELPANPHEARKAVARELEQRIRALLPPEDAEESSDG